MLDVITAQSSSEYAGFLVTAYALMLAFATSSVVAFTYRYTYNGLSYSRNYVQTLILISIVASMVIMAVGDSLARGLGIMAAMAIIRFRTNFKDARDIVYIFAALAAGISSGAFAFSICIAGIGFFCTIAIVLHHSPMGDMRIFDGLLRFSLDVSESNSGRLEATLQKHCKRFALVTLRSQAQDTRADYSYHVRLKKNANRDELVAAINQLASVGGVTFLAQEATVEI